MINPFLSGHRKTFRDNYLAVIAALILLMISGTAHAQIFQYPNPGTFGTGEHRRVVDSTLYFPTGCGVPSDSTFLHSFGFNGYGQRIKQAAKYYDSCGHHEYVWDPSASAWHQVDAGGGSDSGFAVLQSALVNIPLAKLVSGTKRFVLWDTSHTNPGAIVTQQWRQALSDSLQGLIGAKLSSISTANSVTGLGTPASPLQMVNDVASPGNSAYYGTNGTGAKGYYALPTGVAAANPTSSIGLTTVNGVASTFMRSDAAPSLSQAIAPIWSGQHTFSLAPIFSSLTGYLYANGSGSITASTTLSPNWVNVVNSGVDNTGSTDVTAQINTLQASGNKNLYFPPGSYAIKELKMLDSVFFRGDGMKTKFIVSTNDTILTTGNYDRIIGITFIGNRGTTAQIAVNADKTVGTYVNDCQFINMGVGIRTARSAQRVGSGVRVGNVFSDLQGNGNNIGAWCDVQGEYNSFINIHFPGSLVYGFKNGAGNNYFDRCDADSSAIGFFLQGGTNDAHSSLVASHFNHCYQKSFYAANVANGFQVVGSAFYYARFEIDTSVNIVVQNSFIDCTGDSLVINTVTQSSFSNVLFPTTPVLKQVGTNTVTFRSDQQSWDRTDVTTGIHLDDPFHAKHFNFHHNNGVVTYGGTDVTQNILYGTVYTDLPGIVLNGTAGAQTATINSTAAGNLQITATGGKVGIQTAAPDAKLSLDVTGSTDLDKIFSSRNPSYTNNATGIFGTGVSDLNTHSVFQLGLFSHTAGGALLVGTSSDQASGTGLDLAGIIGATVLSNTAILISAGKYSGSTDVLAPIGASEDALKIENISASGINTSGNPTLLEVKGNGQLNTTNGVTSGQAAGQTGFHSIVAKTSGVLKLTTQDATSNYQLFLPAGYPTVGQVIGDSANSGTNIYTAWQNGGTGSGVTTVGPFSASSQTNGAGISGATITFGPADVTNPGMVTTGAQTIAGVKTFNSSPVVPTVASSDNSTNAASTAFVKSVVNNGSYTPTLTNTTNIASSSLNAAYYTVSGNIIHVMVSGTLTCTATATLTTLTISLPPSYNATTAAVVAVGTGMVSGGATSQFDAALMQIASTTTVTLKFWPSSINAASFVATFDYSK